MNRHTRGFVDDNHVIILVNDTDRIGSDRGLMPMSGMRYEVPVLQYVVRAHSLAIHGNQARLHGFTIVLERPVAELALKNVNQLPAPPSFFAPGVVCIEVRRNATQAVLEIVGPRPWFR
jgi:hypothetical protein